MGEFYYFCLEELFFFRDTFEISFNTGLDDLTAEGAFDLFPNPNTGQFQLQGTILGRPNQRALEIDLLEPSADVYFVKFWDKKEGLLLGFRKVLVIGEEP